jgi:hypothetical protein
MEGPVTKDEVMINFLVNAIKDIQEANKHKNHGAINITCLLVLAEVNKHIKCEAVQ